MCELLALSFNEPVNPNITFANFRQAGKANPDGWGIGFYPDRAAQVIKEPIEASQSRLSEFLKDYTQIKSPSFVAHVRNRSTGLVTYSDTHPFTREVNGQNYVFAHNGTLNSFTKLRLGCFKPIGGTDSEYAFCHLLDFIKNQLSEVWDEAGFTRLWQKLREINSLGSLNCVFSNGEYVFCYHDQNGYTGLNYLQQAAPFSGVDLEDDIYKISLVNLTANQHGFIIASRPLTDNAWVRFAPGQMLVFRAGEIVYSSAGKTIGMENFSCQTIQVLGYIRRSPDTVSLADIAAGTGLSSAAVLSSLQTMLQAGYILKDNYYLDDSQARFFTEPTKRGQIDQFLASPPCCSVGAAACKLNQAPASSGAIMKYTQNYLRVVGSYSI